MNLVPIFPKSKVYFFTFTFSLFEVMWTILLTKLSVLHKIQILKPLKMSKVVLNCGKIGVFIHFSKYFIFLFTNARMLKIHTWFFFSIDVNFVLRLKEEDKVTTVQPEENPKSSSPPTEVQRTSNRCAHYQIRKILPHNTFALKDESKMTNKPNAQWAHLYCDKYVFWEDLPTLH